MATTHSIPTGIDMTPEELLRLPRGRARFELIRGELCVMEPGGAEHGRVAMTAGLLLAAHVRQHELGWAFGAETGFVLSEEPKATVRAPDASFVTREHAERVGRTRSYWPGAPDFCIEIVSPNDSYAGVLDKAQEWVDAGCRLVVVADPDSRRVTAHRPPREILAFGRGERIDCSDVVAGFALDVDELFA